jgi:hypothetical protein
LELFLLELKLDLCKERFFRLKPFRKLIAWELSKNTPRNFLQKKLNSIRFKRKLILFGVQIFVPKFTRSEESMLKLRTTYYTFPNSIIE